MRNIQEQIQVLLCKLLEESGNKILYNKKQDYTLDERLSFYQAVVEDVTDINNKLDEIIAEIEENY